MKVNRGEIYLCDLGAENKRGSEQKLLRPFLILSNDIGHKHSTICMGAVITTKTKANLPTHYIMPKYVGLYEESQALLEHILTVDVCRIGKLIGKLDDSDMKIVECKMKIAFGIE